MAVASAVKLAPQPYFVSSRTAEGEKKHGVTFGMLFIISLQPSGKWTLENSVPMVTMNTGKTQESANPLCCADRKILLQHTLAANLLQSLNPSWWAVGSQGSETQPGVLF